MRHASAACNSLGAPSAESARPAPIPAHMTALAPPWRAASTDSSVWTAAVTSATPLAIPKTVRATPKVSGPLANAEAASAAPATALLASTSELTRRISIGARRAPTR